MKDIQTEMIMSSVSFGSVYGNNYDLSGYATTPKGSTSTSPSSNSDSTGEAGGSFMDHLGYVDDMMTRDPNDSLGGYGWGVRRL